MDSQGNGLDQASYRVEVHQSRNVAGDARNLVVASFLRGVRYGNEYFKLIDGDRYYFHYGEYVCNLLNRDDCVLRLAILEGSPEVILGWSLIERNTLHFVFVKKDVRRQGIAKALVPGRIETITHLTKTGLALWSCKTPEAKFNPFA